MGGFVLSAVLVGGIGGFLIHHYFIKDHDVLEDRSMGAKLKELPNFLGSARRTIKIATDFDNDFFNDTNAMNAIKKAIKNRVEIRILCEKNPPKFYKNYEKQDKIEIKKTSKLPYHLWVVDERHVRLERPHPNRKFGTQKGDVALVFKGFPRLGSKYAKRFEDLWSKSS